MSETVSDDADTIAPEIAAQRRSSPSASSSSSYSDAPDDSDWNDRRHPPFAEGNTDSITHGARSPRKIEAIAKRVSDELLERFPIVESYPETLLALARVEGITRLLFSDLAIHGVHDRNGAFKSSVVSRYLSAERTAARLRSSLGLTPESEASVLRDRAAAASSTADAVGELIRQGRQTRAQNLPAPAIGPVTERQSREDTEP